MQKRYRIKRIRVVVFLAIILLVWLAIRVQFAIRENEKMLQDILPETYMVTGEDSTVIAANRRDKIQVVEVKNSKVRQPISILRYNEEYNILLYKIELNQENSLQSILHQKIQSSSGSVGYSYREIRREIKYVFNCLSGQPKAGNQIYLALSGDSISTVVKNDSVVSYHLNCKNLSIRYDENSPVDIFVEGEKKSIFSETKIPMDILFLRRNKFVYFLIMTPMNDNSYISSDLLYKTVIGE